MGLSRIEGTQSRRLSMRTGWELPRVNKLGQIFTFGASLQTDLYNVNAVQDRSRDDGPALLGLHRPRLSPGQHRLALSVRARAGQCAPRLRAARRPHRGAGLRQSQGDPERGQPGFRVRRHQPVQPRPLPGPRSRRHRQPRRLRHQQRVLRQRRRTQRAVPRRQLQRPEQRRFSERLGRRGKAVGRGRPRPPGAGRLSVHALPLPASGPSSSRPSAARSRAGSAPRRPISASTTCSSTRPAPPASSAPARS